MPALLSLHRFSASVAGRHGQQALRTPDHHQHHQTTGINMLYSLKSRINSRDTTSKLPPESPQTAIPYRRAPLSPVKRRFSKGEGFRADKALARSNSVPAKPANAALMVKAVSLIDAGLSPANGRQFHLHAMLPTTPQRHPQQAVNDKQA